MWFALIFVLIFLLIIALFSRGFGMCEEEVITVTENADDYNVSGYLMRHIEGIQAYVIDPVDQQKIWINSNDNMYEDADGKIWKLN